MGRKAPRWQEKLADELHKPIRRTFTKRRVIVHNVDDIWCSDLVDMQKLSKWNKGEEQWDCRGLANQSAVFQISTNQSGGYGSRDIFGREGILGTWDRV